MTTDRTELWRQICDFSIDGPEQHSLSFAAKLARENGWTNSFAEHAILEYKRFVFLAMTAGHPVCPSDQVDQVWHLHLTCTRSYWERFCKETLGRPLHHEPTRGGPIEDRKHEHMYGQTLAAYRLLFEQEPPAEFWPVAAIRFGDDVKHRRVNTRSHWIVPKAPVKHFGAMTMLLAAAGIASGCVAPLVANAPQDRELWLAIYVIAFIGAFCAGLVVRRKLRQPSDPIDIAPGELDRYDLALMAGGPIRVFDAVLIHLCEQKAITFDGKDKFYVAGRLSPGRRPHGGGRLRQG